MIVKQNLNPVKIWTYTKVPMLVSIVWSFSVWLCFYITHWEYLAINFTPMGVLGSALAIFVAFRNNAAYSRWWEARTLWGGIVNASRVLSRLIITFTDSHAHQENYDQFRSEKFKKELVYGCIAWVHALRFHLRKQNEWESLREFFSEEDFEKFNLSQNKPTYLQLLIGKKIYKAMGNGTLGGFDSFQMEGQLLALANYQGSCERIKNTPLPKQYDFFTRLFVLLFVFLLPFGLLGIFVTSTMVSYTWITVPLSVLLSGVFIIMERTGAANENPFENRITDVPLTAICNTIERDLREMLGENTLPMKTEVENGYLY